jgi:hypothetical protein
MSRISLPAKRRILKKKKDQRLKSKKGETLFEKLRVLKG